MTRPGSGVKPLVTVLGASGFVGSAVTAALARRPVRLRVAARSPRAVAPGGAAEVETRAADLTVPGEVAAAVAGADAVVHLVAHSAGWRRAAEDPGSERVNVGVMRGLVEAVRARPGQGPPPVVVFAGSSSQVGPSTGTLIDGTEPDRPETAYDRHKQAAEQALKAATAEGAVRGVSLRLPTVFGPGTGAPDRGALSAMARRALAGEPLTMWHDGTVRRDLLYVHDAAAAFLAALDHADALAGGHWLLGTGRGERLGDVFRMIAELAALRTGRPPVPVVSVPPPAHAAPADARSVVVDSSMFRSATGWRPRTPLRDALDRTVAALARGDGPVDRAAGPGPAPRFAADRPPNAERSGTDAPNV